MNVRVPHETPSGRTSRADHQGDATVFVTISEYQVTKIRTFGSLGSLLGGQMGRMELAQQMLVTQHVNPGVPLKEFS